MGGKVYMNTATYGNPEVRGDISDVHIGKYCSIAQGVIFDCGMHHNMKFATTFPFNAIYPEAKHLQGHPVSRGDINIGNDVWIGEGALVFGGVRIHNGAVIGARAVVTKDVMPYSVVVGSPAREVKRRFDWETIEKLQLLKWWDWNDTHIKENLLLLMSENVKELLTKFGL